MKFTKAWEYACGQGYIWNMSADHRYLAVVAPHMADNAVHVVDIVTGRRIARIAVGDSVHSVAVIDTGEILLARGARNEATSQEPRVWLERPGRFQQPPRELYISNQWPKYDQTLLFGRITLMSPGSTGRRALISGMSDRVDTKGFLLLASWGEEREQDSEPQVRLLYSGIDEAPWDLEQKGNQVYIATGKAGTVEVFDVEKQQFGEPLPSPSTDVFSPTKLTVTDRFVVAASYNEIFCWEGNDFKRQMTVSESHASINGLSTLEKDIVVYTLTSSNEVAYRDLAVTDEPTKTDPTIPMANFQVTDFAKPCWIRAVPADAGSGTPTRLYVTEYLGGRILAINVVPD